MRLVRSVTAVAALGLLACGQVNGNVSVTPTPTPVGPPTQALLTWATFPAGHKPRPVVLVANLSPDASFGSSEAAKMAAACHKLTSAISLGKFTPRTASVTWSTGTKGIYLSISSSAAFDAMTQSGLGPSQSACDPVQPLVVTAVRYAGYRFFTDRGHAQIDSWLFTVSGISSEIAYPALPLSVLWNADLSKGSVNPASTLSADGLTLTFGFAGAVATGSCGADYRGLVAESGTAVAIALKSTPHSTDPNLACPTIAQQRQIDVSLASPLGGRVVLDAAGNLTPVCPAAKPGC